MRKYFFDNQIFSSIEELAYWIYCKDHNIEITRNMKSLISEDQIEITPSFIDGNNNFLEVRNIYTLPSQKRDFIKKLIDQKKVIWKSKKDLTPIFHYCYIRYGKSVFKSLQVLQEKDFKRKIIQYDGLSEEEFKKYKNKNIRFHYICSECGKDVYPVWKTIAKHSDHLCKQCRKSKVKQNATN